MPSILNTDAHEPGLSGAPRSPLNNDRFWGGRSADKAVVAA